MPLNRGHHPNGGRITFIQNLEDTLTNLRHDLQESLAREELSQCCGSVMSSAEVIALQTMGLLDRPAGSNMAPSILRTRIRAVEAAIAIMRSEA